MLTKVGSFKNAWLGQSINQSINQSKIVQNQYKFKTFFAEKIGKLQRYSLKHVILNWVQDLTSERPCDPEINSGRRRFAFTLAEVLITLAVVGVVAAITIPIVMANYQKTQYVAGLKKAYSQMNQALAQMALAEGCPGDLACTKIFASPNATNESVGSELVKYFNVVKNCRTLNGGCLSNSISENYDGSNGRSNYTNNGDYTFITADGMSFRVEYYDHGINCTGNWITMAESGPSAKYCSTMITVDVNGLKKPNNYGRDIFAFYITNGAGPSVFPVGTTEDGNITNWRDSTGTLLTCFPEEPYGVGCAGRIIEEGWQMNY